MASLIPGYEYDIFISYRQKDNKHDGWVSEFVDNLKGELESTFKDDINLYFDINPHDGLLEMHDVNASLKEKLKCLVFIPIISQTYCDSRSFAWQHELVAFNKFALEDQLGRDIKLANGNVESRILPVKIYDLDPEDKILLENELGGELRGIEFIYKSPGVNRPLTPPDNPDKNLNKTLYRDQINKVANSLKDIITAIKKQKQKGGILPKKIINVKPLIKSNLKSKIILISASVLILIVFGYALIPKLIRSSEPLEKSIAILPFRNDSPNDSTTYFIDGVMEEILTNLQNIKDIRVISRTSVEQYRGIAKPTTPEIAKKLGVNYIVEGSGQKYGNKFRLRVQLIKAAKESHLWARSYEQEINEINDIFVIQSQIAEAIAAELKAVITPQEEELIWQRPTSDTLAYDYYLKGRQYFSALRYDMAIDMYSKAIQEDPAFVLALLSRSDLYSRIYLTRGNEYKYTIGDWRGCDNLAREDLEKALKINPNLPEAKYEQAVQLYSLERKYDKALDLLSEVEYQMSNNSSFYYLRGAILRRMGKWEQSLSDWHKTILLDPLNASGYIELGHTYRLMRKDPEALDFFNKSLTLDQNPENKIGKFNTILLWKGNLKEALTDLEINPADSSLYKFLEVSFNRQYEQLLIMSMNYEDQFAYIPRTLNIARAYFFIGKPLLSSQYADSAITEIKLKIKEFPDDDRYYEALAFAYAYKGEKKRAIENAQKAVKLKPIKLDAWQGYQQELNLVHIYIITGEFDLAMDKIEFLLTIPGELSVPKLKIDPAYDKLHHLPRFEKILMTRHKTTY